MVFLFQGFLVVHETCYDVRMVLPGHLAGGYIAATALLALSHAALSPHETLGIIVIGTLAGEAPDIDLAWFSFKHLILKSRDKDDHRNYVTHAPAVWLLISLVIAGAGFLAGSLFIEFIGWAVLVGSWSHFILDSIEHGVMWLWPFSKKRFCLIKHAEKEEPESRGSVGYYWRFITKDYPKTATMYVEIAVTVIAIWMLMR